MKIYVNDTSHHTKWNAKYTNYNMALDFTCINVMHNNEKTVDMISLYCSLNHSKTKECAAFMTSFHTIFYCIGSFNMLSTAEFVVNSP